MDNVYFSALLPSQFELEWVAIKQTLERKNVNVNLLKATKDIWCRDYMPVKNAEGNLIQFRYNPSYLDKTPEHRSITKEVLEANNIKARYSNINLDGGNVIINKQKAIITDRVVLENPEYSNKHRLLKEIEELLEVELIVMPSYPPSFDMTGHIDGMIRWVDESILIGNDLDKEEKWLSDGIKNILKENNLDYIPMPFYEDKTTSISAKGIYVNYLELKDIIIFPIFEQRQDMDDQALKVISEVFPGKEIIPIKINAIAEEGGLMNCISWH